MTVILKRDVNCWSTIYTAIVLLPLLFYHIVVIYIMMLINIYETKAVWFITFYKPYYDGDGEVIFLVTILSRPYLNYTQSECTPPSSLLFEHSPSHILLGHKGQLSPCCRALGTMIKKLYQYSTRLSTHLGSKTLNTLGLGGGGGGAQFKTRAPPGRDILINHPHWPSLVVIKHLIKSNPTHI